jgi:MFS family permease
MVFLSFFAIFEIGSVICGAATSSTMLIIGRAIAGLGGAGLLNGGYTIIYATVPLPKQPGMAQDSLQQITTLIVYSHSVSWYSYGWGPGWNFARPVSWRTVDSVRVVAVVYVSFLLKAYVLVTDLSDIGFYINLPCGSAVALLLFFVTIPDRGKNKARQTFFEVLGKLDLIGFSIFAPAIIQLILALQWGGIKFPWSSATIIGLFCGAFGTILVFIAWEYRKGNEAMIPYSIFGRRAVWGSCMNMGFLMGCMLTATYYLPIYFQAVQNTSPTMSGVHMLPSIISTIIFGMTSGALGK